MKRLISKFIDHPENSAQWIEEQAPTSIDDRVEVVEALSILITDYVLPVTTHYFKGKNVSYLNLQDIAQSDFSDLLLGLLVSEYPSLSLTVNESNLVKTLDEYGFEIEIELSYDFFKAWMALRALGVIRDLLGFLHFTPPDGYSIKLECKELRSWGDLLLPYLEKSLIEDLIDKQNINK